MIAINLDKARVFGHKFRRALREQEFQPYDAIIAKQIPGSTAQQAEVARQSIREKYAAIQIQIDAAQTPQDIKFALGINN